MTHTRISLRIPGGWTPKVANSSPTHCDTDGARLHQAPHGGLYCDRMHEQAITRYTGIRK